jgi:glycyl-tRNA synthetase (class II)
MHYKLFLYTFFLSSLSANAHLGSASGDMHLETEKVKYEDINGYKKSSGFDLSASVNVSQSKGSKASLSGQASAGYHRSYAKQKITSSLGLGTLIERNGNTDIKRTTVKAPLNYLDTKSEMKLDSEMVKLAADPLKAAKEVVEDSKKIYTAAEGVVETAIGAPKYGLVGTAKQLQNTFVDLQTINTLAAGKEGAKKINEATFRPHHFI